MSKYELLERIGVGGMAEVFRGRATAVGGFEKPVAIKKILPHLSQDDRFVRLLIGEAKLLSSLRQRNIVQCYDVGLGEDGAYFLVMEYVDGNDLGHLFEAMQRERARLPTDLALFIASEVCEALEHAHRVTDRAGKPLSIVHRDVSPSNVLLSRSGEVKLTDFGIAKKVDQVSVVQTIAGKFSYMSPEQALAKPLAPQSDIYSLGVILWELLLSRRLFSGVPEFEVVKLVREARVPRPREVDPAFPRELEALLLKALAADPGRRYPSAAAFGAALRDYRYASTSAGDPAREIARLVERYARGAEVRERPAKQQSRIVRIETVAGFAGEPFVPGGKLRAPVEDFDRPTVAAPDLAAVMAMAGEEGHSGPATMPAMPAVSRPMGGPPPPVPLLAEVDAAPDDAQTRLVETRRARPGPREPTPTIREIDPAILLENIEPTSTVAVTVPPESDLLGPGRRRTMLILVALVALALVAFVIAGALMSGGGDADDKKESAPPAGEALDAPAIKSPTLKRR